MKNYPAKQPEQVSLLALKDQSDFVNPTDV
jgi:hypothetical protein